MSENYDVIIIGSGAGGGTLAHALAGPGKRILLLERGDFLPREMDNWDPKPVFVDGKYISKDTWFDRDGKSFQPQVHYFVGGATKLYGAALYRRPESTCIRCTWCDGYPCLVHAKADAEVIAVRPLLGRPNVTLLTGAEVTRLETDDSGRAVTGVVVSRDGNREVYRGDIVAVCA